MYVDLVCVGFLLTVCGGIAWIGSFAAREAREESQAACERRREKERLLKSQVTYHPCTLSHPLRKFLRAAISQHVYCAASSGLFRPWLPDLTQPCCTVCR